MIARLPIRWIADSAADIAALRTSWRSIRGGWAAAWRDTVELAQHRQIAVVTSATTPLGTQAVLRTRVRLSGETETNVLRIWLHGTAPKDAEVTVKKHFQKVAAATAGWPAALGMVRLGSRVAGIGGLVAIAARAIRALVNHEPTLLLHVALGPLLVPVLVGLVGRPILRRCLRAMIRRVPLGVPASS